LLLTASELHQVSHPPPGGRTEPLSAARWFVLWTRSHCERLVHDQLLSKGLASFLPEREIWSRRGVLRHVIRVPMFPGYLFLHALLDKPTHVEVRKARGLVSLLGSTAEGPAAVPETEVTALQKLVQARIPAAPHPYLREGVRVRITSGPLLDVEGVLLRNRLTKGMLVLSVNMLQRSVAVEVDCTIVTAA
jgi:transcription termination/antitermination protein NusG